MDYRHSLSAGLESNNVNLWLFRKLAVFFVPDEKMETAYEYLEQKTMAETLRELVDKLDVREAAILRYRFGLDGGDQKTLEEVGDEFGVTRERIRQLQNIALGKLRKRLEERERTAPRAA